MNEFGGGIYFCPYWSIIRPTSKEAQLKLISSKTAQQTKKRCRYWL